MKHWLREGIATHWLNKKLLKWGATVQKYVLHIGYFFFSQRATNVVYGNSQARGQIGAAGAALGHSHSNTGLELHLCDLCQHPQPTELSEARG